MWVVGLLVGWAVCVCVFLLVSDEGRLSPQMLSFQMHLQVRCEYM